MEPRSIKRSAEPLLGVAVGVLTPALSVGAITGVDAIVVASRTDELPDADGIGDCVPVPPVTVIVTVGAADVDVVNLMPHTASVSNVKGMFLASHSRVCR